MILVSRTYWGGMPFDFEPEPGERETPHVEKLMDVVVRWIEERFA